MARVALIMTVAELGAAAQVAPNTFNRFEKGKVKPNNSTLAAIQRALEAAGVEFIERGVRLKDGHPVAPSPAPEA